MNGFAPPNLRGMLQAIEEATWMVHDPVESAEFVRMRLEVVKAGALVGIYEQLELMNIRNGIAVEPVKEAPHAGSIERV